MTDVVSTLRDTNMRKRRERILHAARTLIAADGFEALNVRALAAAAGVTVPTLYNLIGRKEAIVVAMYAETVDEIARRIQQLDGNDPRLRVESLITVVAELFAENEAYARAAVIAVEQLNYTEASRARVAHFYRWGEGVVTDGCRACGEAGLLRGQIDPALLGAQIFHTFLRNIRAWAYGHMNLDEFRCTGLVDVYIGLAADAVDTFRKRLVRDIDRLAAACDTPMSNSGERSS